MKAKTWENAGKQRTMEENIMKMQEWSAEEARAKAWENAGKQRKTEEINIENIVKRQEMSWYAKEMRAETWENAGKQRKAEDIRITGHAIETVGTWNGKMQEMSWEAEETRSKCRNRGNKECCRIYEL